MSKYFRSFLPVVSPPICISIDIFPSLFGLVGYWIWNLAATSPWHGCQGVKGSQGSQEIRLPQGKNLGWPPKLPSLSPLLLTCYPAIMTRGTGEWCRTWESDLYLGVIRSRLWLRRPEPMSWCLTTRIPSSHRRRWRSGPRLRMRARWRRSQISLDGCSRRRNRLVLREVRVSPPIPPVFLISSHTGLFHPICVCGKMQCKCLSLVQEVVLHLQGYSPVLQEPHKLLTRLRGCVHRHHCSCCQGQAY